MKTVTAKEIATVKDSSELIIDIRDAVSYKDWHIHDSENIDVYADIWAGNLEKVKQKLERLPKGKTIVTVCNAGVTSKKASEILASLGYSTKVLEGGMMGWNAFHKIVDVLNEKDLLIKQIIRIGKGCLSYLVGSNSTKECFIIDPSQFIEEYVKLTKEMGFKIKGVIETHVHADHLSGAKSLSEITKTEYYISGKDFKIKMPFVDLENNNDLLIGNNTIKVINTPGHTDGSVCLLINNTALLTGDTVFLDGVGRPDLERDKEEIERGAKILYSTLKKIKAMGSSLIILPAHFTDYTDLPICERLGTLLNKNNSLKINSEYEFVDYILNNLPMSPPNYRQIKNLNINCTEVPRQIGEKLEFGPNRCASK